MCESTGCAVRMQVDQTHSHTGNSRRFMQILIVLKTKLQLLLPIIGCEFNFILVYVWFFIYVLSFDVRHRWFSLAVVFQFSRWILFADALAISVFISAARHRDRFRKQTNTYVTMLDIGIGQWATRPGDGTTYKTIDHLVRVFTAENVTPMHNNAYYE